MHLQNVYAPRARAAFAAIVAAALFPLSCAAGPAPQVKVQAEPGADGRETPGIAETRPEPNSRDEFTVVLSDADLELDPRESFKADEAQVFTALYEGLFSYHPLTLEPVPAMASKWELSEDKRSWTFTLRDGARYWNGDEVRAADFRAAWLSLIDPARNSPYSSLFDLIAGAKDYRLGREKDTAKIGIEVPNDRTLVVKLSEPAAFFPSMLCHHSFAPVHPSMLAVKDWSERPPISNGPFYIVDRKADRIVMAKNELYWDAKSVGFKSLVIRFATDGKAAASFWDSGEARWIAGDIDLDALRDRSGVQVNAMFATHYYYVRSEKAPWNDRRVSRALALALPWNDIREGHMLPAPTLIFPIPGYPKLEGIGAGDLAEAKRLLAEAGYPGGAGLEELVIRITPSEDASRIAGLMAKTWKEGLGIPVRVETVPYDDYYASLKKSDYVVGSTTWIGDFADPYTFLQMWRADSNLNDAHFDDDRYEELVEKSMGQEGEERWKTLAEAERVLIDDGAVLPISYTPALNIVDMNEVDGWFPNPLDIHPFKYLSFAAYRPLPGVALAPRPRSWPVRY